MIKNTFKETEKSQSVSFFARICRKFCYNNREEMIVIEIIKHHFQTLQKSDYTKIHNLRDTLHSPLTASSEKSIFSWQYYYDFTGYDGGDFFLVYSGKLHRFLYPFGSSEQGLAFIANLNWPQSEKNFAFLSKSQAESLIQKGYAVYEDRDDSEYIYETGALALTAGNLSPNFKRKCRKFSEKYPYTVRMINQVWLDQEMGDSFEKQLPEVIHMLKHYTDYEMYGIEIRYQNEQAFIFGYENTPDTFTMTGADYTSGFGPSAIAACIHELALRLDGRYRYINLEEDMGIEGLRRMKQLYLPVFILEAYHADFKND